MSPLEWLDRNLRLLVVGLLGLLALSWVALVFVERKDKHAACIEALKSEDVGDLARHLLCSQ